MDRRNVESINVVLIGGYAHGRRITVDPRACNVSIPHLTSLGIIHEQYWARRIDGVRRVYAHATLSTARALELVDGLTQTETPTPNERQSFDIITEVPEVYDGASVTPENSFR